MTKNFNFFHRITTDLLSKSASLQSKGFRDVQSILQGEQSLKHFNSTLQLLTQDDSDFGKLENEVER